MKILITSDLFKPSVNGVVTSVLNLEEQLKEQGHEVRILTISDRSFSYRDENVYYVQSVPLGIYPDIRLPISRADEYIHELIKWKPDVVHSQCEFFSFSYARRIVKETGAVLIHTYHTMYEQYTEYVPLVKNMSRRALKYWMKIRLRNVDTVIAPTVKVERTLQLYEIQQNIKVLPSGIRLSGFQKQLQPERSRELKEKHNIPEGRKVLLSLGRLGFEKNVDELLAGFKKSVETQEDLLLLIVGDGPARRELEALTDKTGLGDYVRFTGMARPEEVTDCYKLGDVFVCASTSETQGLTYIEAMAAGLPLVCKKDPCLSGVLEEGVNGRSFEDAEDFADIMSGIWKDENWLLHASDYGRELAGNYSSEKFGRRMSEIYINAISKRRCEKYESIIICEKPENSIKKWRWACHGYAGRVS